MAAHALAAFYAAVGEGRLFAGTAALAAGSAPGSLAGEPTR